MRRLVILLPALTVVLTASASAQTYIPTSGTASWNLGANWTGGSFPNSATASATLSAATGPRTIDLNQPITVETLTLAGSPTGTTTIAPGLGGTFTFKSNIEAQIVLQAGTGPSGPDLVFAAPVALESSLAVSGGTSPRRVRFDGTMSGLGGVFLSSTGTTLTFAGNGTSLLGAIEIDSGRVLVNGTVGSEVIVGASPGNSVGGTGTIFGGTNVAATANLAPGDPTAPSPVGQLTTHGLTLGESGGGANYRWQLGALSTSGPGTNFDQVVVTGAGKTLSMAHANNRLVVDLSLLAPGDQPSITNPFWQQARQWTVIDVTSGATNAGNLTFGGVDNGTFAAGTFILLNPATQGGDVVLQFTPVPEPGAALAAAAVGVLGWRVRRRRSA